MIEIVYTEGFIGDIVLVHSSSKREEIRKTIDLLLTIPTLGSNELPDSINALFGPQVRKLVVKPFLIIYEYHESDEAVIILGLMHEKAAF